MSRKTRFVIEEVFKSGDIDESRKRLEELLYLIILRLEFRNK